ncbi:1-hydroxy-2-methyl-2-(E)-butenyl 4-diphosphate synthase [Acetivibrio straminisolvens JCM 21531]|uniref:1-hydroxy-2-methyl-2-(E)-butenyl 4-diphosphate synthase n=1 Tax=Acetivibrio straminisolvens JCM 21531 TaxID=1294263 RepID=W4V310_9FIRM|nr:1-hydroxy-2-methyl-2-(E)-butenyl 4-diphosphate synthase [Acetivibrio straminisolvens JCM 21531]
MNSGSLEKNIVEKYGGITPEAMVESALGHARILEELDFHNIVISLKASNVPMTIAAYRLISEKTDYPLHIGVTEAGTVFKGTIKSCAGLGCLLAEGIGDTVRVSLTGDPKEEVLVGHELLRALGIEKGGIEFVSCPTCGRCQIDLIGIAEKVEKRLGGLDKNIKVAIMGCAVNGPGEAKEADIALPEEKVRYCCLKREI